jgi:hypothetical protein
LECNIEKEVVMSHPEDDLEEPKYWTPEEEAAKDPEKRLDRLLDKAEKQLEAFGAETARPTPARAIPPDAFGVGLGRSQIEFRRISNGFIMTYSKAKLAIGQTGVSFKVYQPVPVEVFVSGVDQAITPLAEAMESAALLAETIEKLEAFYNQLPPGAPLPGVQA